MFILPNNDIYMCVYVYHTWKNFKNDGNQKLQLIWVGFGHFTSCFDALRRFLAILRRFLPLGIVFSPKTTATSFPGMM